MEVYEVLPISILVGMLGMAIALWLSYIHYATLLCYHKLLLLGRLRLLLLGPSICNVMSKVALEEACFYAMGHIVLMIGE